jgi:hypothetical protein
MHIMFGEPVRNTHIIDITMDYVSRMQIRKAMSNATQLKYGQSCIKECLKDVSG